MRVSSRRLNEWAPLSRRPPPATHPHPRVRIHTRTQRPRHRHRLRRRRRRRVYPRDIIIPRGRWPPVTRQRAHLFATRRRRFACTYDEARENRVTVPRRRVIKGEIATAVSTMTQRRRRRPFSRSLAPAINTARSYPTADNTTTTAATRT